MGDPRRLRPLDGAVIGVVIGALIILALGGASPSQGTAGASTTTSSLTTSMVTTSTTATATSTSTPGTTTSASVVTTTTLPPPTTTSQPPTPPVPDLQALQINDAPATTAGYSRDLFPTWLDFDNDGCDTRQEVLVEEAEGPVQRDPYAGRCPTVIAGDWTSIYDGVRLTEPGELDVDHLVPLAEAWRSGAHAWDAERRARFANHLDERDHLIAVTASSNRSKGDSPPNVWRPPAQNSWCRYATAWVQVKVTWALTATSAERNALGQMLASC